MNKSFEPRTVHPDRLGDSVLAVNDKFLRQAADDLPSRRQRHCARRIYRPIGVFVGDLFFDTRDGDYSVLIFSAQMLTRKIYGRGIDLKPAHAFGFADGFSDRFRNVFRRRDNASPQAFGFGFTDANDVHFSVGRRLADDASHPACPDV